MSVLQTNRPAANQTKTLRQPAQPQQTKTTNRPASSQTKVIRQPAQPQQTITTNRPAAARPKTAMQSLLADWKQEKWYKGDEPTSNEIAARIYTISQSNKQEAEKLWAQYQQFQQDPSSPYYNPYTKATNNAVNELQALGADMSSGITDDWINSYSWLKNHYRTGTGGTPLAPSNSSTKEENAAYWYYKVLDAEDNTRKAENEWAALQEELKYWAQRTDRNYSNDEIRNKVDWSKYPTLAKMDAGKSMGTPLSLNRSVGYSQDALDGVIWAARNNREYDPALDSVRATLGQGKTWKENTDISSKLDSKSDNYNPYCLGSTLDDAALYFGVSKFDQKWLDDNRGVLSGNDETAKKYYQQVYKAEQTTQKAEEELADLYKAMDYWVKPNSDPDKIIPILQSLLDDSPTLAKMDESLKSGSLLSTTRAVNYRWQDIENEVRRRCLEMNSAVQGDEHVKNTEQLMNGGFMNWSVNGLKELEKSKPERNENEGFMGVPTSQQELKNVSKATVAGGGVSDVTPSKPTTPLSTQDAVKQYNEQSEAFKNQSLYNVWDTLTRYNSPVGGPEDKLKIKDLADRFMRWYDTMNDDPEIVDLVDLLDGEDYERFESAMEQISNNSGHLYTDEEAEELRETIQMVTDKVAQGMMDDMANANRPTVMTAMALAGNAIAAAKDNLINAAGILIGQMGTDEEKTVWQTAYPSMFDGYLKGLNDSITNGKITPEQCCDYVKASTDPLVIDNGYDAYNKVQEYRQWAMQIEADQEMIDFLNENIDRFDDEGKQQALAQMEALKAELEELQGSPVERPEEALTLIEQINKGYDLMYSLASLNGIDEEQLDAHSAQVWEQSKLANDVKEAQAALDAAYAERERAQDVLTGMDERFAAYGYDENYDEAQKAFDKSAVAIEQAQSDLWFAQKNYQYYQVAVSDGFKRFAANVKNDQIVDLSKEEGGFGKSSDQSFGAVVHRGVDPIGYNNARYYAQKSGMMTRDERIMYTYLLNSQGQEAADAYREYLDYELADRYKKKYESQADAEANRDFWGYAALTVESNLSNIWSTLGTFDILAQHWNNGKEYKPINYYNTYGAWAARQTQINRQAVMGLVDWQMNIYDHDIDLFDMIYGAATSGVDSYAMAKTGSILGAVLMGSNASISRMQEMKDMGCTDSQILLGGLVSGVNETLFEHVSIENFMHIGKEKGRNAFVRGAKTLLKRSAVEFSEEFNTELANMLYSVATLDDKDPIKAQYYKDIENGMDEQQAYWNMCMEVLWQSAEAGVSGVLMTLIGAPAVYAQTKVNASKNNQNKSENIGRENRTPEFRQVENAGKGVAPQQNTENQIGRENRPVENRQIENAGEGMAPARETETPAVGRETRPVETREIENAGEGVAPVSQQENERTVGRETRKPETRQVENAGEGAKPVDVQKQSDVTENRPATTNDTVGRENRAPETRGVNDFEGTQPVQIDQVPGGQNAPQTNRPAAVNRREQRRRERMNKVNMKNMQTLEDAYRLIGMSEEEARAAMDQVPDEVYEARQQRINPAAVRTSIQAMQKLGITPDQIRRHIELTFFNFRTDSNTIADQQAAKEKEQEIRETAEGIRSTVSYVTRAVTAMEAAEGADEASQTNTLGAVLMQQDENGNWNQNEASAAAQHIVVKAGDSKKALQTAKDIFLTAAENGIDLVDVKKGMTIGALSNGHAGIVLDQILGGQVTRENVQALADAATVDSTDAQVEADVQKTVMDNRVAQEVKALVANGALKTDEREQKLNNAKQELRDKRTSLEKQKKELAALGKELERLNALHGEAVDAVKNKLRSKMTGLLNDIKNKMTVVGEYEQGVAKAERDVEQIENTNQAANEADLTAVREQAQQNVEQQMAAEEQERIEAEQKKQAEEQEKALAVAEQARQAEEAEMSNNVSAMNAEGFIEELRARGYEPTQEEIQKVLAMGQQIERTISREPGQNKNTFARQVGQKYGINIVFADTTNGGKRQMQNGFWNPNNNTIVLDSNATVNDAVYAVLGHELTHVAEQSGTYGEMAMALLKMKYKGVKGTFENLISGIENGTNKSRLAATILARQQLYNSRFADMRAQDASFQADELDVKAAAQEVVADVMGEIMRGNQDLARQLAGESPSVARRIVETIKDFLNKLKGVKGPWKSDMRKAVTMLENALNEAQGQQNSQNQETKYMLRDSSGNVVQMDQSTLQQNKVDVRESDPSLIITQEDYQDLLSGNFIENGSEYFNRIGGKAISPILGEVILDRYGLSHIAGKGDVKAIKAMTIPAIKHVIENGKLVHIENDHKGKDTAIIAEKINMPDANPSGNYIVGVLVAQMNSGTRGQQNKYSFHGAFAIKENAAHSIKPNGRMAEAPVTAQGSVSIGSILREIAEGNVVNGQNNAIYNNVSDGIATPVVQDNQGNDLADELRGGTAVKSSLSSWTAEEQARVREALIKRGFSEADVDKWINDANGIAATIAADRTRLDFTADPSKTMLKPNAEYVKTLDASTLCAKRLLYQGTFNAIQHLLPNTPLMPTDLIDLSNMMREMGYETPCGICYVESRRRNLGKFAAEWLDNYQGSYKPTLDEVTTSDGLQALKESHPDTYQDFVNAMNKKGTMNPKVVQLRTDYRGEIRDMTPGQIQKVKNIGGLRVQSFSDFEVPHMLDMMQATMDMSAKELTAQGYCKVKELPLVFGDTGIKINVSLIGKGEGVDANGNLLFDDVEGMKFEDAMKVRDMYSKNVGTILVGINDNHILTAMADDRIDFIIPFHKSGWSKEELAKMPVLDSYSDYTDSQNEKKIVGRTKNGGYKTESLEKSKQVNFQPVGENGYWDFSKSGKENAETYLKMCAEDGRLPKFSQFLVDNGDGSFSLQPDGSTDGYWKTLIDFKMYDNDGVGSPQTVVVPNFNMEEANRVLNDYSLDRNGIAREDNNSLPVAQPVVDRYVEEYKAKHPGVKYSLPVVAAVQTSDENIWQPGHSEAWFRENGFPIYQDVPLDQQEINRDTSKKGHGTQIASTESTYRKLFDRIKNENPDSWHDMRVLDASSGLGLGTQAGRDMGFQVTDIEPFPNDTYDPDYTDYEKLLKEVRTGQTEPFDFIISNAVLNVIPQDTRDNLVAAMGNLLKPGGSMFVNVISKDYEGAKKSNPDLSASLANRKGSARTMEGDYSKSGNANGRGHETFVWGSNSVQKVFSTPELIGYLKDALGDGYSVKRDNIGMTGVLVTKDKNASSKFKYSLQDESYMKAVESNDMETAQAMVDEAARNAGYNTLYVMWRGDSAPYNVLKTGSELDAENDAEYSDDHGNLGDGLYFTPDRSYAEQFARRNGGVLRKFYLNANMADLDNPDVRALRMAIKESIEDEIGDFSRDELYQRLMEETGTNGIKATGVGGFSAGAREAIVQESWQAKLADPVTYDDQGNVIPLSERFDPDENDIRYSLPSDPELESMLRNYIMNGGSLSTNTTPPSTNLPGTALNRNQGTRQRQWGYEKAQRSKALHDKVKDYLRRHSGYDPDTNNAQISRAIDWVQSHATEHDQTGYFGAMEEIQSPDFNPLSADGQARMLTMMSMAALNGDVASEMRIADLYNQQGTDLGRALQARQIFRLMTPLGRVSILRQEMDKINKRYIENGKTTRVALSEEVLQEAANAQTEEEFEAVQKKARKELAEQMPPTWKEKLVAWRMLSMLGNPRTHIRNFVGNALFAPVVKLKNVIAAGVESAANGRISDKGEMRTKSIKHSKDAVQYAKADAENMQGMLTGEQKYGAESAIDRERKIFGTKDGLISKTLGKALQWASDKNSKALEAEDWFFLKRHYISALAGWMTANKMTAADMEAHPEMLDNARAYAIQEAQKATYRDANELASLFSKISRKGGAFGFIVDAVLPFKKTPANILRRGIEYSPVGLLRAMTTDWKHVAEYSRWQNGELSEKPKRAISVTQHIDRIAAGLTGTAITALGAILAHFGIVTASLDDDDEFDKQAGEQKYSLKFSVLGHDISYTIDWAAPMSMPFFVGTTIYETLTDENQDADFGAIVDSLLEITEPVFNLSMLDGVNSLLNVSSWNGKNALTQVGEKVATNYISSFVPTLLGQASRTIDPVRRNAYVESGASLPTWRYMIEQIQNKTPFSVYNIPYRDVWGEEDRSASWLAAFENLISPGYINEINRSELSNELERLYNESGESVFVPKEAGKTLSINGETVRLTAEQYDQYVKARGETAKQVLTDLMNDPRWNQYGAEILADVVSDAWKYANAVGRMKLDPSAVTPDWIAAAHAMGNASDAIYNRRVEALEKARVSGYNEALTKGLKDMDFESVTTSIQALVDSGRSASTIKQAITKTAKPMFIEAMESGDLDTAEEIIWMLIGLNMGYKEKDIRKWVNE